jgi:stearoyl-CoA desaturase (delta-9 desaturase)
MTATTTSLGSVQHLRRPRGAHHGITPLTPEPQGRDWAVILFMGALHVLALVALLPQFWSLTAIGTLAVLYWVTACLGVTIGYHRLLSHRAFRVPRWLTLRLAFRSCRGRPLPSLHCPVCARRRTRT